MWDYDYFDRSPLTEDEVSYYANILDFDVLRKGKQIIKDRVNNAVFKNPQQKLLCPWKKFSHRYIGIIIVLNFATKSNTFLEKSEFFIKTVNFQLFACIFRLKMILFPSSSGNAAEERTFNFGRSLSESPRTQIRETFPSRFQNHNRRQRLGILRFQ